VEGKAWFNPWGRMEQHIEGYSYTLLCLT
jgi:hypothetical protein